LNRLLDREQVGDEETSLDDEEEDGFLKAFKVFFFFNYNAFVCYLLRCVCGDFL
jgi:hypothetical protein